MPRKSMPRKKRPRESDRILTLIAVMKLVKAALLIALGIGALRLLHRDLVDTVMHWIDVLRVDPDNRYVHRLLERIFNITPRQLKALSIGTFFYAALFAVEGIGLWMRKRWAEYVTVITTSLFIPLEIYEIFHHVTLTRVVVTVVNLLIVWYLILRLRTERRTAH
jgi:uncharacterized membrane protein (DUF2068 family)